MAHAQPGDSPTGSLVPLWRPGSLVPLWETPQVSPHQHSQSQSLPNATDPTQPKHVTSIQRTSIQQPAQQGHSTALAAYPVVIARGPTRTNSQNGYNSPRKCLVFPLHLRAHPLPFVVPSWIAHGRREAHTLLIVPPCSHITSRWYSSPDFAPAAILVESSANALPQTRLGSAHRCPTPILHANCRAIVHHTLSLFAESHGVA